MNPSLSVNNQEQFKTPEELADFIVDYEFNAPNPRFASRIELQRYYAHLIRSHMEAVISDLIGEDLVPNTFDDRWVRQIPPNITHYETEHDAKIINENNSYQRQRAKSYLEGNK